VPVSNISLKLPDTLARKLAIEARKSGRSKSEIVRTALEKTFGKKRAERATFYELTSHLAGSGRGPGDLSTNKRHMATYGK
jgi:predicted transcriptional regulator